MVHATKKRLAFSLISIASTLAFSIFAMGCSDAPAVDCAANPDDPACTPPNNACSTTSQARFVIHQVTMPGGTNHFPYDVDGDGSNENKVEDVVVGLEGAGLSIQAAFDSHLEDGDVLMLMDVQGGSLTTGCANVILREAKPAAMPPAYNGMDSFTPNPDYTAVKLAGNLTNGKLTTTAPKNQPPASLGVLKLSVPITLDYKLPLILYGARVEGQLTANGVTMGRLHGALKKVDIENFSFPVVAQALTQRINELPNDAEEDLMISIFENTQSTISQQKCATTPALCCATNPTTCKITPEEVGACPLIKQLIAPDIRMFEGETWTPTPGGGSPESLSFGIGFAGVKATF
jgi:hypothetical protein